MRHIPNRIAYSQILLVIFFLTACAEIPVHVNTLPPPAPSVRLRVYVQPHTTVYEGRGHWGTPHEKFVAHQIRRIEHYLADTGIYEIVSSNDARAALGDQNPTVSRMERNDWALAREIGRALHADYVMVLERGTIGILNTQYFLNMLINVETGKKFGAQYSFTRTRGANKLRMHEIMLASYHDIFRDAKEDLLSTAIRKSGRVTLPTETAAALPIPAEKPKPTPEPKKEGTPKLMKAPEQATTTPTQPPVVQKPRELQTPVPVQVQKQAEQPKAPKIAEQAAAAPMERLAEPKPMERDWVRKFDAEKVLTQESAAVGKTKLVVYDLTAPEQYKTAALILTEALREELFRLKQYTLVDRENLQQVLQEMALQQTGLIDEKQAVKTGKGLAANQVVTGNLGLLGKIYVLQAKRIDVETFATLGLTSAKFKEGQEEEVLSKMPDLAKSLSGLK